MKILLTNDDGYSAPGILALYDVLKSQHDVILIAPDMERSGVGHGVTLNEPMRFEKIELHGRGQGYMISGTPADCVKLGLFELYASRPDLVISGINPGSNTGVNLNYSGTVGAAREAALNGIRAVAVSIRRTDNPMDFKGVAQFVARFVAQIPGHGLPSGTFLNINAPDVPMAQVRGIRITRQGLDNVSETFERRMDPKNRAYYWYGSITRETGEPDTDVSAVSQNYMSITPIQCDTTDYNALNLLGTVLDDRFR
jgi:5'-nucleotidase